MATIKIIVGDDENLTPADSALQTLAAKGGAYSVVIADDADDEDTTGIDCVVFSTSIDDATLGNKYRNPSGVGVVSIKSSICSASGQSWFANPSGTGDSATVTIDNNGHPLNNGLTTAGNDHTIYATAQTQQQTTTSTLGQGTGIMHRGGSGSQRVCIAWEIGQQLNSGAACAGRHVFAGFAGEPEELNGTGQALLVNAIEWAGQFGPYSASPFDIEDDFSTDEIATNFPNAYTDPDMTAEVADGVFRITYAASQAGFKASGLKTAAGDFTGKSVMVQVASLHANNANCVQWFVIGVDSNNNVYFQILGHNLTVRQRVSSSESELADLGTFDFDDHRFLRIREDSGTTYWETSPDGSTWTEVHSASNPIDFSTVTADIGGGTVGSVATPGAFEWEGFNTVELPSAGAIGPIAAYYHMMGMR